MNSVAAKPLGRVSRVCVRVGLSSLIACVAIAVLGSLFVPEIVVTEFTHLSGHMYRMDLSIELPIGDHLDPEKGLVLQSKFYVLEDGRAIGTSSPQLANIDAIGGGLYSHWGKNLRFSTSDNTDPRTNGRSYALATPAVWPVYLLRATAGLTALCALGWLSALAFWARAWHADPCRKRVGFKICTGLRFDRVKSRTDLVVSTSTQPRLM